MRQGDQAGSPATIWWLTGVGGAACSSEAWTGTLSTSVRVSLRADPWPLGPHFSGCCAPGPVRSPQIPLLWSLAAWGADRPYSPPDVTFA